MATSVVGELAVWNDTAQTQVTTASLPFYLVAATGAPAKVRKAAPYLCDGTADQTEIYLQDAQGDQIALDVQPLDDRVRIRRDDDL